MRAFTDEQWRLVYKQALKFVTYCFRKYSALTAELAIFNQVDILNKLRAMWGQFSCQPNMRLLTVLATAVMMALCPQTQILPSGRSFLFFGSHFHLWWCHGDGWWLMKIRYCFASCLKTTMRKSREDVEFMSWGQQVCFRLSWRTRLFNVNEFWPFPQVMPASGQTVSSCGPS